MTVDNDDIKDIYYAENIDKFVMIFTFDIDNNQGDWNVFNIYVYFIFFYFFFNKCNISFEHGYNFQLYEP